MSKNDYSQYQKDVISGYYNNLDTIMLGKLGELVTELYLADTQAKQNRLWQRANKAMVKLKVPPAIIDHIMEKKDVEVLAKNLQDWLAYKKEKMKKQSIILLPPSSVIARRSHRGRRDNQVSMFRACAQSFADHHTGLSPRVCVLHADDTFDDFSIA